jgi:hypothetical protein
MLKDLFEDMWTIVSTKLKPRRAVNKRPCELVAAQRHANASGVSVRALHHECSRAHGFAGFLRQRNLRSINDQPDCTRRHAQVDAPPGSGGRSIGGAHLRWIPLPVFHPGRSGHGTENRRAHLENANAADARGVRVKEVGQGLRGNALKRRNPAFAKHIIRSGDALCLLRLVGKGGAGFALRTHTAFAL